MVLVGQRVAIEQPQVQDRVIGQKPDVAEQPQVQGETTLSKQNK